MVLNNKKMIRKIFVLLFIFVGQIVAKAQINEVELVVNSSGESKEQAITNGLRMAIEQSFGTFVSSNTAILNDDLVKDEIVTVSSGTIKNYTELSSVVMPSGEVAVSLKVLVSVTKLTEFAESHGSSCELKGATIGANIKLQRLYEKNEKIAVDNLLTEVSKINDLVDFDISVLSATAHGVKVKLTLKATKNLQAINEMVFNTLTSLSLTKEEIETRKELGLNSHINKFLYSHDKEGKNPSHIVFYTRNRYSNRNAVGSDAGDGLQGILLSYINNKINDYIVSCNISSPVSFKINDDSFKSENFICSSSYEQYYRNTGGFAYKYYRNGHPMILLKLDNSHCYPLPNTIWSVPTKGKKAPSFTRLYGNDRFLDKTIACKFRDITGSIVGNIFWEYVVNEETLSQLNGFYIEPVQNLGVQKNTSSEKKDIPIDMPLPIRIPQKR